MINCGNRRISGEVTATVPDGAASEPCPIDVVVTSTTGLTAQVSADVPVIDNVIGFTTGTKAEEPWLFDGDGSQLDGAVFDGQARFTDGDRYAIYRFQLPGGVTGGTLTLDIGNQFLVSASMDGENRRTVLEETQNIRDPSNRQEHALDLNELRGDSTVLYDR